VKITDILSKIKPAKNNTKLVVDQIYMVPPNIGFEDFFDYPDAVDKFDLWKRCRLVKYKGLSGKLAVFYPVPDDGETNFYLKRGVWEEKVKRIKEVRFVQS